MFNGTHYNRFIWSISNRPSHDSFIGNRNIHSIIFIIIYKIHITFEFVITGQRNSEVITSKQSLNSLWSNDVIFLFASYYDIYPHFITFCLIHQEILCFTAQSLTWWGSPEIDSLPSLCPPESANSSWRPATMKDLFVGLEGDFSLPIKMYSYIFLRKRISV